MTSWHGHLGDASWAAPRIVARCDEEARPGYASEKAHEYTDEPDVLAAKVKVLASLLRRSKNSLVYCGAGISTASGIDDYATRARPGESAAAKPKLRSPWEAQPTQSHRVLSALHAGGFVKHLVQQNHDGLPQKAGFPQAAINEIHGGWYDPSNPVVPMDGALREDLFSQLLEWENRADLVLALGSSLCGMNSDRLVTTCAERAARGDAGALGSVIVSLQRTQHDAVSSLRIFAKLDDVFSALAKEMSQQEGKEAEKQRRLVFDVKPMDTRYVPTIDAARVVPGDEECDIFEIQYDESGRRMVAGAAAKQTKTMLLDLSEGSTVRLTVGPHAGDEGTVLNKNAEGHWRIQFQHRLKKSSKLKFPFMRVLGSWWVEAAIAGTVPMIPVTTVDQAAAAAAAAEAAAAAGVTAGVDAAAGAAAAGAAAAAAGGPAGPAGATLPLTSVAMHYANCTPQSDRKYDYSHLLDKPPPPAVLAEIRQRGHLDDAGGISDDAAVGAAGANDVPAAPKVHEPSMGVGLPSPGAGPARGTAALFASIRASLRPTGEHTSDRSDPHSNFLRLREGKQMVSAC